MSIGGSTSGASDSSPRKRSLTIRGFIETITRLYKHLLERGRKRGDSNQVMYETWRHPA
jgi:hypothetical protein